MHKNKRIKISQENDDLTNQKEGKKESGSRSGNNYESDANDDVSATDRRIDANGFGGTLLRKVYYLPSVEEDLGICEETDDVAKSGEVAKSDAGSNSSTPFMLHLSNSADVDLTFITRSPPRSGGVAKSGDVVKSGDIGGSEISQGTPFTLHFSLTPPPQGSPIKSRSNGLSLTQTPESPRKLVRKSENPASPTKKGGKNSSKNNGLDSIVQISLSDDETDFISWKMSKNDVATKNNKKYERNLRKEERAQSPEKNAENSEIMGVANAYKSPKRKEMENLIKNRGIANLHVTTSEKAPPPFAQNDVMKKLKPAIKKSKLGQPTPQISRPRKVSFFGKIQVMGDDVERELEGPLKRRPQSKPKKDRKNSSKPAKSDPAPAPPVAKTPDPTPLSTAKSPDSTPPTSSLPSTSKIRELLDTLRQSCPPPKKLDLIKSMPSSPVKTKPRSPQISPSPPSRKTPVSPSKKTNTPISPKSVKSVKSTSKLDLDLKSTPPSTPQQKTATETRQTSRNFAEISITKSPSTSSPESTPPSPKTLTSSPRDSSPILATKMTTRSATREMPNPVKLKEPSVDSPSPKRKEKQIITSSKTQKSRTTSTVSNLFKVTPP